MQQPHIGPSPIGRYIGMPATGMTPDSRFQALPHLACGATLAQTVMQITPRDYQ
ncbi:hypothetical protein [Peristeroidobacter agariperforans]|uniref:hypothetical protein n=1 Tax=Peristeroidobacter agariperforans TaxID=268404 RepID=UPI0013005E3F|nr:hypothetical protein [Peristeroidobacter agariperforans]